jgi:hypothetical protein
MQSSKTSETLSSRIKSNAALFGNKAASLIELNTFCQTLQNKHIKIKIPEIFPISHEKIKTHLDEHAKNWKIIWNHCFLVDRNKESLKTLRRYIIKTFRTHPIAIPGGNKSISAVRVGDYFLVWKWQILKN